ncbi:MAG: Nif3-like dinuclear metal center hexameric protein [Flavobacteriaceae bacterium]|nr:Nif3-like dinuclear metal center hexameric protein [Flavobacteriaceae bacterium]
MKISEITTHLETIAPRAFQESYDNSGLLLGNEEAEISSALLALDVNEAVVDEAIAQGCNLIIAHHPLIFGGLKKLTGGNATERTVLKAIKNDVAVYAIHTNLDNVLSGVNAKIAERIGLIDFRILQPREGWLFKLAVFVPNSFAETLREALFTAGAGQIGNYDQCSFNTQGKGTFRAGEGANPFIGKHGVTQIELETKVECVVAKHLMSNVLAAMKAAHPYEEVAYNTSPMLNTHPEAGSGLIGNLETPLNQEEWLAHLKKTMNPSCIKFTKTHKAKIQKIAVCGGAGSFLLTDAISQDADAFVTSDFKYHEFFGAEERLMICDIGHWESEIWTTELLRDNLLKRFPTFAARISDTNTNPVNYYY